MVITKTPKKFITEARMIAPRTEMARVEIAVAIALGASVHPFTKITPIVRITVTASNGFDATSLTNEKKSMRSTL
jgi:hypothetical protein